MNKATLCKQIGDFFGTYFEENGQYCIDNGAKVFRYDTHDALLADWVDTLVENHHDTAGNSPSLYIDINDSWEKEIVFIYSEVIGKLPVGIRKAAKGWQCSIDVQEYGNPHGKNLYLGTYSSIVDAIFARKQFSNNLINFDLYDMDSMVEEAKKFQACAKEQRQAEKYANLETKIKAKYNLSSPDEIVAAVKTAQRHAADNTNQSLYEAAWLAGYAKAMEEKGRAEQQKNSVQQQDDLKLDLGFATLVAEKGADPNYNEVYVGLEDKDGVWSQDLAVIGQKYHYNKDADGMDNEVVQEKGVRVLVYSDKDDEDYTHEFSIDVYEEEALLKPSLDEQVQGADAQKGQQAGRPSSLAKDVDRER